MSFQQRLLMRKIRKTAEHKINVCKDREKKLEGTKIILISFPISD